MTMQQQMKVCADCSSTTCDWCSVNRGVYLCVQCAAVHRQLGRHVSQVKHLTRSSWRASQLRMVHELAQSGANFIWEHLLLDPSLQSTTNLTSGVDAHNKKSNSLSSSTNSMWKKRKPTPQDPMHPVKVEFIREKYMFAAFFKRNPHTTQDDLNQQLYASVRTNMVTTSLQLLAMGANPNFWHPVRGNTPLHVACQCNQVSQAELLITYGAALNKKDSNGTTPLMIAYNQEQKQSGSCWSPLIACLIEAHYEVCDSLSLYLNQRVPDHSHVGQHFLMPSLPPGPGGSHAISQHQQSLLRLAHLDPLGFHDLAIDVFDEIMRRLTNRLVAGNQDYHLFFLPLHREYSSTRNQARQKLARLGDEDSPGESGKAVSGGGEFVSLVWDVYWECRRRMGLAVTSSATNSTSRLSTSNPWQSVMTTSGLAVPSDGEPEAHHAAVALRPHLHPPGIGGNLASAGRFSFVPQQTTEAAMAALYHSRDAAPFQLENSAAAPKRNSLPGLNSTDLIQEEDEPTSSSKGAAPTRFPTGSNNPPTSGNKPVGHVDSFFFDPVYDHVPFDTSSEHTFSGDMGDSQMGLTPSDAGQSKTANMLAALSNSRTAASPKSVSHAATQTPASEVPQVKHSASQTGPEFLEDVERCRRMMEEWKMQRAMLEDKNAQQQQSIQRLEMELAKLQEEKMRHREQEPPVASSTVTQQQPPAGTVYTSGNPHWANSGVRLHQEMLLASSAPGRGQIPPFRQGHEASPLSRPHPLLGMKVPAPPYRASPQLLVRVGASGDEYQKAGHPMARAPSAVNPGPMGQHSPAPPSMPPSQSSQPSPYSPPSVSTTMSSMGPSEGVPSQFTVSQQDRLVSHVNYIASLVKQLLEFGQHNCREEFVRCACQIQNAVEEMTQFMPTHVSGVDRQELLQSLHAIMLHSRELRRQCENAVKQTSDTNLTHFITCAHDIIMATRTLLTNIYRLDR